jgi:5-oxopent-3-ene-1,2,5-tricarboxylate decarboxylase/2-hydroxyhepta-2,4-diene-1,7-dioate isomerase
MALPAGIDQLELGAALGLVMGRTAYRVGEGQALEQVAGCVLIADLSVPHSLFYRPSVRFKALDGSCVIGPLVAALDGLPDPGEIVIEVAIDGLTVHRSGGPTVRSAARLLAEVSEFMTLRPGDVLMLGVSAGAPRIGPGARFELTAPGLGRLQGQVLAEAEADA